MRRSSTSKPRSVHLTPLRLAAAVVALLALVLTACGGDDSDSGSARTTTGEGGATPTGAPIKVMTEAPVNSQVAPYPNIPAAAEIYEQYINAKGGIKGRPLQVIVCDDRADASEAANCARKAVEEKVVANVGSFTVDVSRGIPILEQNNIAWFGVCCPIVSQENTSKISFPMGFVGGFPTAAAIKMVDDGCKSIVEVYGDLPVADVFHAAFANGYKSKGLDPSKLKVVKIPLAPGDYSAQAAQATSPKVDCLFANISDVNWAALLPALAAIGQEPRLYGPQGNLNAKIAEQFPEQTENGVVVNVYPNLVADVWEDYRDSLEKYDAPDLDWNSLAGLGTWTAFTAFTQIAESIQGDINNVTFLEAANKTTDLDTGGMVANIDFTKEWTGGGGQFTRIFNRNVFYDVIKDGKLTPLDDKSYDMTLPFDGKPA